MLGNRFLLALVMAGLAPLAASGDIQFFNDSASFLSALGGADTFTETFETNPGAIPEGSLLNGIRYDAFDGRVAEGTSTSLFGAVIGPLDWD